jgi:hypothetical protein
VLMLTQSVKQARYYSPINKLPILGTVGSSPAKLASLTLTGHEAALRRSDEVPDLAETQADAHGGGHREEQGPGVGRIVREERRTAENGLLLEGIQREYPAGMANGLGVAPTTGDHCSTNKRLKESLLSSP